MRLLLFEPMCGGKEIVMKKSDINERNYGIDFLRIVAMMMVCMIHSNNKGGIMASAAANPLNTKIAWFLQVAAYGAVNCYAMISGYVGMKSKHKYANLIYLYIQVVFYILCATAFFRFTKPEAVPINSFVRAFFPFAYDHYWYFTAYFAMSFFIPFMNKLLNSLNKREAGVLAFSLFAVFSVLPCIFMRDIFKLSFGYSAVWLSALYLIGGCIKILQPEKKINKKTSLLIYLLFVCITFASVFIEKINKDAFLFSYTSPTVLLSSCALVVCFSQMKINELPKKIISFFSPLAFGVYLIHTEPLIWQYVFDGRFKHFGNSSPVAFVLLTFAAALGTWLACSIIDYVRLAIFKIAHIKVLANLTEKKLLKITDKCFNKE